MEYNLLNVLTAERNARRGGGIYHKVQVALTYNSNRIEGSKLTEDQTRRIFETNTIGAEAGQVDVDDIIETSNHFRAVDYVIDTAKEPLTEEIIKHLHFLLKNGTKDSREPWFAVGDYKKKPNEIGGAETCPPKDVPKEISKLLAWYDKKTKKTVEDIIEFHQRFESIHPFQDGNGRVGRLIMFKECLNHGIVPFIIDDGDRWFYYRGLREWGNERGFLIETCLAAQDVFKEWLKYFELA